MGSLACRAGENKSLLQNASYGLAALKALLDAILADTGTTLEAKLDTIDSIVDAILVDTGTTLEAKLDTIDSIVDAILVDTGTTLEAKLDTIDSIVDAIRTELTFQHQADAAISQDNPVSGTWYPVLNTTANVRIISISATITWAVTQPTPLEVRVTIDGNTITHFIDNPVSAAKYGAYIEEPGAEDKQSLSTALFSTYRAFMYEGRSVKVEIRITWATTQPTPLVCRVKWAKR